jgi:hypothetical protein
LSGSGAAAAVWATATISTITNNNLINIFVVMLSDAPKPAAAAAAAAANSDEAKELTCPITHELLHDPVIAEDGHTYERAAISKWFSQGKTRSPVTNEEVTGTRLVPNLSVKKLVDHHRNELGKRLLALLEHQVPVEQVLDLLQRGAHVNVRDEHGVTPLLLAISKNRLDLVRDLVEHGADPSLCNDRGENSVAAARRRRLDEATVQYLVQVEQNFVQQHAASVEARARERDEHRRTQEILRQDNTEQARNALPVVPGIGFFPSLFGLQFQGALSATDVAPVYHPQQGPMWARINYAADWARFSLVGEAELPPAHEDFKQQVFLSRVLAGMLAVMIIGVLVL